MRTRKGPTPVGRGVAASSRAGPVHCAQSRDDREYTDVLHRRQSACRGDLRGRHRVGAVCRPRFHPRTDVEASARRVPNSHRSPAGKGDPDGQPRPDCRWRRSRGDPGQHRRNPQQDRRASGRGLADQIDWRGHARGRRKCIRTQDRSRVTCPLGRRSRRAIEGRHLRRFGCRTGLDWG